MPYNEPPQNNSPVIALSTIGALVSIGLIGLMLWGCPQYSVYERRLAGESELAQATYNRQIAVQEAEAQRASAALKAEADTIRAHGTARSNAILAHSLTGSDGEAYLRYLWIQSLENGTAPTIVYVPTEAGLPILEAGRKVK